jgi:hypothetical protein
MMEILINESDWCNRTRRLTQILDYLRNAGWEKFGHCGTIILFKDVPEEKASSELKEMKIDELKAEVWEEDMYSSKIF